MVSIVTNFRQKGVSCMKKAMLIVVGLLVIGCGSAPAPPTDEATQATSLPTTDTATPTITTNPTIMTTEEFAEEPIDEMMVEIDHAELLNTVMFGQTGGALALTQIRDTGDTQFVGGLVDSLRWRRDLQEDIGFTLNQLTGQKLDADWGDWVEEAGKHSEWVSFPDYPAWKGNLFSQIDPNFLRFVPREGELKVDPDSRVEEIVWGGVRVDGIPALDNPTMIDPAKADYLIANERVFGVSINGDTRAYPARFLDWHEMFNDVVGGQPISLAY